MGNALKIHPFRALLSAALEEEIQHDVIWVQQSNFEPMNVPRVW